MKLKRFEFGGVGFFHALDLIHDAPDISKAEEDDLAWAEKEFQETLEIPDVFLDREYSKKNLRSFFTPLGLETFQSCIDIFYNAFCRLEDSGFGEIKEIDADSEGMCIVYEDEYQMVAEINQK